MNSKIYYDYINEKLMSLMYQVKTNGKLNLLDLNIHAENFFADLFNIIFDCNLKNINAFSQNIAAIDLKDDNKKMLVQVSSTCTKQKIEDTLNKEILKDYKGKNYIIKFIFIDNNANKLKNKTFNNPYKVQFDPEKDIYDINDIIRIILFMGIDRQKSVFEFIKSALGEEIDILKVDSNLATIINILSEEDFNDISNNGNLNEFNIDEKIEYNNLDITKDIIEEYKVYHYKVDDNYREFDKQGKNKSQSILQSIRKKYISICISKDNDYNEDQIFLMVIDEVIETIKKSRNYNHIPIEELEMCVSILVVDAFIRCKIFKNPKGYNYVATR